MKEDPQSLLTVQGLDKHFGGLQAIRSVNFEVRQGEILGLVGCNGAGKTTLFNLITGFLRPDEGMVLFKGREITNLKPHLIVRLGLGRTFQLNKIFSGLTVEENIRTGCYLYEKGGMKRFLLGSPPTEGTELKERVKRILAMVGLEDLRGKRAEDLPYGDQKLLGIAISLGTDPSLLLLDEPFAGMNPVETSKCSSLLSRIVKKGTTLFLVDHDMQAVMGICQRILVLHFGEKIAEGKPMEIQNNPDVIATYLGSLKVA